MMCENIHSALSPLLGSYEPEQICFVVDEKVQKLTGLIPGQVGVNTLSIPVTESSKTIETVQQIWDFLFAKNITRHGLVVAVGGGVLTDMAGFAAATYKRGIPYISIPTTLLAMVDASTGGKTGVNYHGIKNGIGAFHIPVETLIWPGWLRTLPPHQFLSGFAEMLKTGLIDKGPRDEGPRDKGSSLWAQLLRYNLDTMPLEPMEALIEECVRVKEAIVAEDPQEKGVRKMLNFGHTFGHALEEIQMVNSKEPKGKEPIGKEPNGKFLHGYAVLYGMIAELYLSVTKTGCPKEPLQQLTQIMLHYYGRPNCKCSDREALVTLMQQDKKNERAAQINCTLLKDVGIPVINQAVTPAEALEALEYLFSL